MACAALVHQNSRLRQVNSQLVHPSLPSKDYERARKDAAEFFVAQLAAHYAWVQPLSVGMTLPRYAVERLQGDPKLHVKLSCSFLFTELQRKAPAFTRKGMKAA